MELGWRNDAESLAVKDQNISRRVNWSHEDYYFDHRDVHLQIVPEIIHQEEEKLKQDLLVIVPDEHSETGDHHHHHHSQEYYSDVSDNRCYLRNKHDRSKRRRIETSSDDESEEYTREVPSVTQKGFKRRRDEMSDKIRKLHQLVPNSHKMDKISVLDKTIEYMKNLQLQLKVMSTMGMNTYFPPRTLDFGMNNHLFTAMALANGMIQTASSPLFPASNWSLPQFTNLSYPHSVASSQHFYGLIPYSSTFLDFSSYMERL